MDEYPNTDYVTIVSLFTQQMKLSLYALSVSKCMDLSGIC